MNILVNTTGLMYMYINTLPKSINNDINLKQQIKPLNKYI